MKYQVGLAIAIGLAVHSLRAMEQAPKLALITSDNKTGKLKQTFPEYFD
jgi:hypothetical protein